MAGRQDSDRPVVIREARLSDARQLAEAHVRSMQATYPGIVPQETLDALSADENVKAKRQSLQSLAEGGGCMLVAQVDGRVVGHARIGDRTEEAEEGLVGQLYSIYLDPDWWRQGIGRQLWDEAVRVARQSGWKKLRVKTAAANEGASRFYEAMGCTLEPDSQGTMEYMGTTVETVRYELAL